MSSGEWTSVYLEQLLRVCAPVESDLDRLRKYFYRTLDMEPVDSGDYLVGSGYDFFRALGRPRTLEPAVPPDPAALPWGQPPRPVESAPEPADVQALTPEQAEIAKLKMELDTARTRMGSAESRLSKYTSEMARAARVQELLDYVLSLFAVQGEDGFARSVYVSVDDLNGWLQLARNGRNRT